MIAEWQLESVTLNDAGLNMRATPEIRDIAHRLFTYEAGVGKTSEVIGSPTLRVYEKLRQSLSDSVGVAGFQSLSSRALTLARREAPGLSVAQITSDGCLQGLTETEPHIDQQNDRNGHEGILLIASLLGLLRTFLGEALTFSLLRNAWPGEVFDDRNVGNGRKA